MAFHDANPRYFRKAMVEVRGVTKRYGSGGRRIEGAVTTALDGVSFTVAEGEFVGIMGPSGSGKSTLLNCLATIDAPTSGSITIGGTDISRLQGKALSRFRRDDLGFIFQDANLLDTLTAFENIALALTIQKVPVREIDARVNAAARQLGIFEVLGKYPYQLSGGQRQRVAFASILAMNCDIYVIDEPTSQLDPDGTEKVFQIISALKEQKKTVILVEHKIDLLAQYADEILVIEKGSILKSGPTAEVLADLSLLEHEVALPQTVLFARDMAAAGKPLREAPITLEQARSLVLERGQ